MLKPFQTIAHAPKLREPSMWCPSQKCLKNKICQYPYNCKAMTHDEGRLFRAKQVADREAREAEMTRISECEARRQEERFSRVRAALEAANIDPDDLREWLEEGR